MPTAQAQDTLTTNAEKYIKNSGTVATLGAGLFGDKVNLYTGALEFVQADVSIPGNNALPVSIGRRLLAGQNSKTLGHFGDWDLDIPHLHGVFSYGSGWSVWGTTSASKGQRCSQYGAPPDVAGTAGTSYWSPGEYWHGSSLYIPGLGDQELLQRSGIDAPSDGGAYPIATRLLWTVGCGVALKNPKDASNANRLGATTGEGFTAVSPDGTRYRFDWLVWRDKNVLSKPSGDPELRVSSRSAAASRAPVAQPNLAPAPLLSVSDVWILPTLVTDRFGNTVSYTYDTADPWKLLSIVASDGRRLDLTYVPGSHRIASVSDGMRTWTYAYTAATATQNVLSRVTQPDGSAWGFSLSSFSNALSLYIAAPNCDLPGTLKNTAVSGSMTHPSGASGSFTLTPTQHGRSQVERTCISSIDATFQYAYLPKYFANFALTSKTLTGPGLGALSWTYSYGPANASWTPCAGCAETKTVTVTDPRGHASRYTFGNRFDATEGQLQQVDEGLNGVIAARITTTHYRPSGSYATAPRIGYSPMERGDGEFASRFTPVDQRTISQQGVSFTWSVNAFDAKYRPTSITRASSLGPSRSETMVYNDHPGKWVLGQVQSVTDAAGRVMVANEYDAETASLRATTRFGRLEQKLTYYPDGTLWTRADGLSQTTTFSDYKRGLAQAARYADNSIERIAVNGIGLITAVTDANGHTTSYGYDAMGRLNRVTPPGADTVAWSDTTQTFEPVGGDEYGLGTGHWRQTIATGNGVTVNYFDALWRPRVTRTWDAANEPGTARTVLRHFDADSRKTFESYPQRSIASIGTAAPGIATTYDALGRPTQTRADSELGVLTSNVEYLSGFQTRSTNPRNFATTQSFWALDNPDEALLAGMSAPENVGVTISRDLYGKPLSITRGGSYGGQNLSVTRSYVYDPQQRLCKTVEPEAGATVQIYDAANNVTWRAPGQNLPATNSCDEGSVPESAKIRFTYSPVNQLTGTTYGDGSPGITRSYTPDGLPETVASSGSVWTYSYNKRRLLEQEMLSYGGVNYAIGWGYDPNGHRSRIRYPDGAGLDYLPNALGEASQAGGYARAVSYHPNGGIAGYTLGNNIVHSRTQNLRGLPLQNRDGGVLQDLYGYDANGNVAAITDQQENVFNRALGYDGLDRLTSASAPGVWGAASYSYDPVDNLRSAVVGGRSSSLGYYDGTNRLNSVVTNGATTNYGYDANGNIRVKGSQTFGFDIGNRLTNASQGGSYTYDGLGRRIRVASTDGSTRIQVYSQGGKLMWGSSTGGPRPASSTAYVYLGGQQIAESNTATGTQYVHTDALGSPVAHTSTAGQILNRTRYEPYGFTAQGTKPGPDSSLIGFTGHVNDPETDLIYMQQRYHDPIAGRFLSVDPVVTDAATGKGFGRYHYGANNPYKYTDPDGRIVETPWDAANVAMGVVSLSVNLASGNLVGAAVDLMGIAIDATATAVPGMPGGAATAINAARMAEKATQAGAALVNGANKAAGTYKKYTPGGSFSKKTKEEVAARAKNKCEYCGVDTTAAKKSESGVTPPKNEAQTDHIVPKTDGGTNNPNNAAHACRECNRDFSNTPKPNPRE